MLKVSSKQARIVGLAMVLVIPLACTPVTPKPVLLPERQVTVRPSAEQLAEQAAKKERQYRIRQSLFNGYEALASERLMRPKNDNAYDWFNQVLWLDGSNAEAHRGMREIGKTYVRLAELAYQAGGRARAELLLERAQWVSVSPAQVVSIKKRHPEPVPADNEFRLPLSDLSHKNQQMVEWLGRLAEQAKQLPSRLLIVARTDSEGRWIYKQMRESVEGYRLRGNIQVGQIPKVVLIDMQNTAAAIKNSDG